MDHGVERHGGEKTTDSPALPSHNYTYDHPLAHGQRHRKYICFSMNSKQTDIFLTSNRRHGVGTLINILSKWEYFICLYSKCVRVSRHSTHATKMYSKKGKIASSYKYRVKTILALHPKNHSCYGVEQKSKDRG